MSRQQRGSGAAAVSMAAAQSGPRQNEYFVPRDGIDREVITADICRYLGNDALVRPGTYDDNGRVIQGYYITAYRNLTSAMIADLKADSQRWDQERRKHGSSQNVRYTESQTRFQQQGDHSGFGGGYQANMSYPGNNAPGYSSGSTAPSYSNNPAYSSGGGMYPSGYAGQSPQYSSSSTADPRYAPAPISGAMDSAYQMSQQPVGYTHGGNYRVQVSDQYSSDRMNVDSGPRGYTAASQQPYQGSQSYAYQQQAPAGGAAYAAQPVDNFYGRASPASAMPAGYSPTPDPVYEESQPPPPPSRAAAKVSSSSAQSGSSGSSRRDRDQRDSRDATEKRSRHHHYR